MKVTRRIKPRIILEQIVDRVVNSCFEKEGKSGKSFGIPLKLSGLKLIE